MASLDDRITDLAAKVTALIMLLEGLYADELAKTDDPAKIGDLMVQGVLKEEQKIGEFFAGDEATAAYVLQISGEVSSLIDRAVARAVALRKSNERRRS